MVVWTALIAGVVGGSAQSLAATLATGGSHTCALTTGGGVKCWGDNSYGQLGNGTTTNQTTPVDVSPLGSTATAISAGDRHTCALTTGGRRQMLGYNFYGQLGNGTTTNQTTPVDVSPLRSTATAISAGDPHTCSLTTGGGVKCWGYNGSGQLGNGTPPTRRLRSLSARWAVRPPRFPQAAITPARC